MIEVVCSYAGGRIGERYTYKHNEVGNPIEKDDYATDGTLQTRYKYKYDYKGNKIEVVTYNSDGSMRYISSYKHDDEGNEISFYQQKANGNLNQKSEYKYNSKGKITYEKSISTLYGTYEFYFFYDYNGENLIEESRFNGNGRLSNKQTYTYQFDKRQNWIQKIVYVNDIPKYVIERKYEYYR
jgi:hypothetical protein